jgi:WD40 repeat protein
MTMGFLAAVCQPTGVNESAAQDRKPSPLEEFRKKLQEQLQAEGGTPLKVGNDSHGDPMPPGARARLGTVRFRHSASIGCLAYSGDGKLLAVGGADNKVRLFDAKTGTTVRLFDAHQNSTFVMPAKPSLADFGAPTSAPGPITALAFSDDSKLLATGAWDDFIRLWDVETGKQVRRIDAHRSQVSGLVFSRDGKVLASRGGLDGLVRLWDPANGKQLHQFETKQGRSASLAIAPNNKTVAFGDAKGIALFDVATGMETKRLEAPKGSGCLAFSPNGDFLASGGRDNTLRIWDLAQGKELCRCLIPKPEPPSHLMFSPDGKQLAAAIRENDVHIYDAATGKPLHRLDHYWGDAVAYSSDGKTLASCGAPSAVRLWDANTGKELFTDVPGHRSAVTHLALTTDGKLTASGGDHLRLWDTASGKSIRQIKIGGGYVEALAIAPDHKTVVTGGRDKVLRFFDVESGKELDQLKAHKGTPRSLAYSRDGKLLASGDVALDIRIWDAVGRKQLNQIKLQGTATDRLALAFSPDNKVLACGGAINADFPRGIPSTDLMSFGLPGKGFPILLWDAETAKEVGRLEGLSARVRSLAFSPDGKLVAATSADGRLTIWDARKVQIVMMAHPEHVDSSFRASPGLAFGPDSKTLVSASSDKTLRLWDAVTGKERGRITAPAGAFNAVAIGPDGTVVAGSADTSVTVWDLTAFRPAGKRNFSMGHIDLR